MARQIRKSLADTPPGLRPVQMRLEGTTFRAPEELGILVQRLEQELIKLDVLEERDHEATVDLVLGGGTLRVHARRGRIWHPFYVDSVEALNDA